ncbi:RNA polymerase subunit sigma, partial [Pseudomonas syringae]|nr:RNA polymerase subunit sigma [Pseudomonas syringae]
REVLASEARFAVCSPHTSHDHSQRLAMLERALAELPPACRDSFLLRKLEGMTHLQIAEHLSISRPLVEKHIVNAMKHCRVRMREWEAH